MGLSFFEEGRKYIIGAYYGMGESVVLVGRQGRTRGGEIKFNDTVLPGAKKVTFQLDIIRILNQRLNNSYC
jgi:hypothetical protein